MAKQSPRIDVAEAREKISEGALLVCAYDDEQKCASMKLDGSITRQQLERDKPGTDTEIVLYCA